MDGVERAGAVAVACLVAALAFAVPAAAERPGGPPGPGDPAPAPAAPPAPPMAEGSSLTSFYFGKGGQISPVPPPEGTNGQSSIAQGVSVPRALVSIVGTWSVSLVEYGLDLESLEGMSIWASSDFGATNVRFTVIVAVNGNQIASLSTDTKPTLGAAPAEFLLDPGSGNFPPRNIDRGNQLSFQLQYASSSQHGVGPSADSTFHYYGNVYRSRLDFVTNPFLLNVTDTHVDPGTVNVTTTVKDAFNVPPEERVLTLTISGPATAQPEFVKIVNQQQDTVNGTTITWNWDYGAQGTVGSGVYVVSLSARYVGAEENYTASNQTPLKFVAVEAPPGLLPGLDAGAAVAALGAVAAAAALGARGRALPRERGRR